MKYDRLWKTLMYVFYLFLLTLLQLTLMPELKLFGVHPFLFPAFVAMIAVLEGQVMGGAFGLMAGLCADALLPAVPFFFVLIFLCCGVVVGQLSRYLYRKNLVAMLLWSGVIHFVSNILFFFVFFFVPGRAGVAAFSAVSLPEILFSLLLVPLLYLPIRANHRHWMEDKEEEETE